MAALVALLIATGGYLLGTGPAQAAVTGDVTGVSGGYNVKVTGHGTTRAALIELTTSGGQVLKTYCIDINRPTSVGVNGYTEGDFQTEVSNPAKVLWALEHGYPAVSPALLAAAAGISPVSNLSVDDAIVGTQVAIWYYSDGAEWNDPGHPFAKQVYDYLTGPQNVGSSPGVPPSLSLSPTSLSGFVGDRLGPFTVAMSGSGPVSLSASGGASVVKANGDPFTGPAGNGDKVYLERSTAGTSTLSASATSSIEAGRAFLKADHQTLILAQNSRSETNASATGTWEKVTKDANATVTVNPATCKAPGKAGYSTVHASLVGGALDQSVGTHTAKFKADAGHLFADGSATKTVEYTIDAQQDCRTVVVPQTPGITQAICTGPGTHSSPSIKVGPTTGIDYVITMSEGGFGDGFITATPQEGYALDVSGTSWNLNQNGSASYKFNLTDPGDCLVKAQPSVTPAAPVCVPQRDGGSVPGTLGTVTFDAATGVDHYTYSGVSYPAGQSVHLAPGEHTFGVVYQPGYTGPETVSATIPEGPSADECATVVTPKAPEVDQSESCDVQGTYEIPSTPGVEYLVDGVVTPAGSYDGPVNVTVTAQALPGFKLSNPDWSHPVDIAAALICVTPVNPGVEQATCTAPGQASTPVITPAETEGIEYTIDPEDYVAGDRVHVFAQAADGYEIVVPAGSDWRMTDGGWAYEIQLTVPDCIVEVTPVAPTVTQAICIAPGQSSQPSVELASTEGITYTLAADGSFVTATPQDGHQLAIVDGSGWSLLADGSATYKITYESPGDCLVTVTPVEPTVTQSQQCSVEGSYTIPDVTGVEYFVDGTKVTPGIYSGPFDATVTARPATGYAFDGTQSVDYQVEVAPAAACPTVVVPQPPTVGWMCEYSQSYPVINPADTPGITYTVDGRTVTATADAGYTIGQAEGWTVSEDGASATYDVPSGNPYCVTPQAPEVVQASCDAGPSVTPVTTPGVTYQVSGDVVPGGTVVVTATPQGGFVLEPAAGWVPGEDGTASWTTTLDEVVDCGSVTPTPTPTTPTPTTPAEGGSVTPTTPTGSTPAGSTTAEPTQPTGEQSTTTEASGGVLPHTGGNGAAVLLAGLAALAGGAVLLLVGRRRTRGAHQR